MERQIVATFYKTVGKRLRMDSMTVIQDRTGHDGKVYRSRDGYDVDYSRLYGYIYHNSSGGGDDVVEVAGIYYASGNPTVNEKPAEFVWSGDEPPWTHPKTIATRKRNKTRRLKRMPKQFTEGFASEDLFAWLENNAIEDDAVYCSKCKDYVRGQEGCEHVWWCNAKGDYSTPDERCECKNQRQCWGATDEEN